MTGRCADCAHWVTHRCRDRNQGPSHNKFQHVAAHFGGFSTEGECDRVGAPGAGMTAEPGDGNGVYLFTAPNFGCVEFAPAPAGWDHHRFHRRADHIDGRPNWVIDDSAHAEVRF